MTGHSHEGIGLGGRQSGSMNEFAYNHDFSLTAHDLSRVTELETITYENNELPPSGGGEPAITTPPEP